MSNMENLENTLDTKAIGQVMLLMDSMTRCDKSTSAHPKTMVHQ